MAVQQIIHSVADASGRSDAEIKAFLGLAALVTAAIAAVRAIDALSQIGPFRTRRAVA